ncbi:MAG: bifunctional folylpolyglutamate synthase/dihydrofolate synthase [Flavobacteriaceae bacterium]|nr:bifunctional folylpolyglutamate synthase/dihydrofolate synthase [Flavobacteriaceae bacterium]
MTYQETLDWMFVQLPMYQKVGKTAYKIDLSNTELLASHLNNPEKKFKSIHVAGTNGKGSTSHMIASVLQEAGYKVGLYTSPHLKDYRERIKINGEEISETYVVNFIKENKMFFEENQLSFFEMTVGLAFEYFASEAVDIAVIEVGLGGRLDSTNIITPEVSVITNIGFDHTQFLGETISEIASEKAGIIKPNVPVVVGEYAVESFQVFDAVSKKNGAPLIKGYESPYLYETDLQGKYQIVNIKTAVAALKTLVAFPVSEVDIIKGLGKVVMNTGLKGRWQIINESPKVICDTAHNKEGLSYTLSQLKEESYENLHIVIGVVSDKDISAIAPLFPEAATYYFCKPNVPRGMNPEKLQAIFGEYKLLGSVFSSVPGAYSSAVDNASQDDVIYVGGSTFVVAEII